MAEPKKVTIETTTIQALEFRSALSIAIRQIENLHDHSLWGVTKSLKTLKDTLEKAGQEEKGKEEK